MPTVSIIIPSYNHALYIEEAISSVLTQSFADFELIIIDDASEDQSWQLIQQFNDPRITAIQHIKNQGANKTINHGLAHASGDYLTILNSDDSYHPMRLERLIGLKKDFVATDLQLWDNNSDNKESQEKDWVRWFEHLKADYKQTEDFLATLLKGNFLITTSNFFFSRELYQQLNGFKDLRYVHDYEFAIRALFTDCKVAYCQEKLLNYRLHDSNTIREAPLKAIQENVNLLLSLSQEFSEKFTEKPQYLISLSQHLSELYQYTNEEWQSKNHYKLLDKERELFDLIKDRDTWIKERDNWIHERDNHIKVQNQWLSEQEKRIKNLDDKLRKYAQTFETLKAQLSKQQSIITEQTSWVADRDVWIAERDDIVKSQQRWLQDRDKWIQERDSIIEKQQCWIQERDQIITELNEEIQLLRNSHSYRLGQLLCIPAQPLKKIIKGGNYA